MILLTSGCSFAECISDHIDTWPRHLQRYINIPMISKGLGSQGNGLISRSIIYEVDRLLKQGHSAEDMLVGIMWSGYNRWDYYWHKDDRGLDWKPENTEVCMSNPTNFINDDHEGDWIITNHGWKSAKDYYKHYYDDTWGQIQTLEHVLRTQWFLEKHKIRYFMMPYMDEVFQLADRQSCQYLFDQIDWNTFATQQGCSEYLSNKDATLIDDTLHPTTEGHATYTKEVLIPYLTTKGYIV